MSSPKFSPPWRDAKPDGYLGPERGPKSAGAFATQSAKAKDWSYQPEHKHTSTDVIHEFMSSDESGSIADSMRNAYTDVFCDGYSIRGAAEFRGLSRSSIKSYIRRLRKRAVAWASEQKE